MPTPMPPRTIAAIESQVTAVSNRLGARFPVFADDIFQEAWACALQTAHRFDPDSPGARGYFYRGTLGHVAAKINQWIAVPSISRAAARAGVGTVNQIRIDPASDGHCHGRSAFKFYAGLLDGSDSRSSGAPVDPVEAKEAHADLLARLTSLRLRYRRAVDRAVADLTDEEREVGALVLGLDGPPRTDAWIARSLGVWADDVARSRRVHARALKRRPEIKELEAQITQVEEELP